MGSRSASDVLNRMLQSESMVEFIETYNVSGTALLAVCNLATIIMIIFHVVNLSKSADNPMRRRSATTGLAISIVAFIILGGIDGIYALVVSTILGLP